MNFVTAIARTAGIPPIADAQRLTQLTGSEKPVIREVKWTISKLPAPVSTEKKKQEKKCLDFIIALKIEIAPTTSAKHTNNANAVLIFHHP